jgi:alpha/beta hydrolase fold
VAKTASTGSRSSGNHNQIRERWAQRGFSAADWLNLWKPNGAWEQHGGLAYGSKPRQKLDVYKPHHAVKAPILVFFYGGSWQRGSRDLYPFVGASLAAQGIVTVVPDYSIFPPARFPMFVEDAARAVRFVRENAAQWGGDPARLVLMGLRRRSAGDATPLRHEMLGAALRHREDRVGRVRCALGRKQTGAGDPEIADLVRLPVAVAN